MKRVRQRRRPSTSKRAAGRVAGTRSPTARSCACPATSVCSNSGRPSHSRLARGSFQMRTASSSTPLAVVGSSLQDVEDRVVVELHRRVVPHAAPSGRRPARMPGGSASPTGRTPHERSRVPHQRSGVTVERLAADLERPCPAAGLREALACRTARGPCLRMNWRGSSNAGIAPSTSGRRRSPCSFGSRTKRTLLQRPRAPRRGTGRRSCPCGRRARATRAPRGGARRAARTRTRPARRGSGTARGPSP